MVRAFTTGCCGAWLLGAATAAAAGGSVEIPKGLDGSWEGVLRAGAAVELRLVLHVTRAADGAVSATVDSPDQGALGLPVTAIRVDKGATIFTLAAPPAELAATLNAARTELSGQWRQSGAVLPIVMKRAVRPPADAPAQLWEGKLELPARMELRLILRVSRLGDGALHATLDSPDQGATGLKVDAITLDETDLKLSLKAIGGEFSGKLDASRTQATGEWRQGGSKRPLTLKRTEKPAELPRPQTPKRPYPYREEEIAYENRAAGVRLAGTLTLPGGAGPFPAVLLITGSGPQDRDGTLVGHKPFLVLADALTRRGIAVLRVDDRGVGGSTGDVSSATSEDFAGDVLAGVAWLKTRKEIDPRRIGLVGHSEGGLIAPMAAVRSRDVAFIVLMAGPGVPGDEILVTQGALILRAMGANAAALKRQEALQRDLFRVLRSEKDPAEAAKKAHAVLQATLVTMSKAEREMAGDPSSRIDMTVKQITDPWFRFFLDYDPRPTLAKVRCPVLAVSGEKDLQVPAKQNLGEIAKALARGGNKRVSTVELPGLNHLFQPCKTGAPAEYGAIEETISPAALTLIGDFILQHARNPS